MVMIAWVRRSFDVHIDVAAHTSRHCTEYREVYILCLTAPQESILMVMIASVQRLLMFMLILLPTPAETRGIRGA
eukprot:8381469-Karenia_brevis.AAC.1